MGQAVAHDTPTTGKSRTDYSPPSTHQGQYCIVLQTHYTLMANKQLGTANTREAATPTAQR